MSKSSKPSRSRKTSKTAWVVRGITIKRPYSTFPLTPHASGKWMKKIRGRIYYFGNWGKVVNGSLVTTDDFGWNEALDLYKVQADDLHAGREPQAKTDALTVAKLCNAFLEAKHRQYEAGELSARMYKPSPDPERLDLATGEYKATTDRLVKAFGGSRTVESLTPADFAALRAELAAKYGPVRLGNEVQKVRTVFKYAIDEGQLDKPVTFGKVFTKPSKRVLRQHRAKSGKKLFTADELRKLIDAAGVPLRAMILLGINCGFGGSDCGHLKLDTLDLDAGWVTFPRPKTGIERKAKLWPETVAALRDAIAERPAAKGDTDPALVFITKYGNPWATRGTSGAVILEFTKLLGAVGIERDRLGFYALRHTLRTVADATRDFPAVRVVMGHADDSIDDTYRESIEDERLEAVANHVRGWLWPETEDDGNDKPQRRAVIRTGTDDQPVKASQESGNPATSTIRLFIP